MTIEILSPSKQMAEYLRAEMLKGRWIKALPGTPTLATELGVDRKTITAALEILEAEGLMEAQGLGRKRRITLSKKHTRCLNIQILLYESNDQQIFFINQMMHRMKLAGHKVTIAHRSLLDMGMDAARVARFVKKNPADAWVVLGGSRQVLEWFANQDQPAFAVFGRRRRVSIPSVGPDKEQAIRTVVRRLVELGHRDIVYLAREERRKPNLGYIEHCFLDELKRNDIAINTAFNLPDWQDNTESFQNCLRLIFQHKWSPPTAIILDESQFLVAAMLFLSQTGLLVPRDVSLICSDAHSLFDWCQPEVAHISWDGRAVVEKALGWIKQLARRGNVRNIAHYTTADFIEGGTIGPAAAR